METYKIGSSDLTYHLIEEILASKARLELSDKAIEKIKYCREYLDSKTDSNTEPIYGVTTGFGSLCKCHISPDELSTLQENLVKSHSCSVGTPVSPVVVKLMLLLKAHALSIGFSGVQVDTVRRILENEAYLGHTVQHKEERFSYKDHRTRAVPPDEWIRVENTHEPIITKELWDECRLVDSLNSRPRQSKMREVSLFSGLLYCADCGFAMRCQVTVRKRRDGTKAYYEAYMCGSYSRSGHTACTTHYIPKSVLEELVFSDIQARAEEVCIREKEVIRRMTDQRQAQGRQEAAAMEKSAKTLKKRLAELERLIRSTYEDKVLGKIPEDICVRLMAGYQSEQAEKSAQLKSVEKKLEEYRKAQEDVREWAALIRQYKDADILDRDMLLRLVDRIEVGEARTMDGEKEREIRIHYKFVGDIG